jgi:hypothetical protein
VRADEACRDDCRELRGVDLSFPGLGVVGTVGTVGVGDAFENAFEPDRYAGI